MPSQQSSPDHLFVDVVELETRDQDKAQLQPLPALTLLRAQLQPLPALTLLVEQPPLPLFLDLLAELPALLLWSCPLRLGYVPKFHFNIFAFVTSS